MQAVQVWSSYAVNLLKAKLAKLGTKDTHSIYVWELQERGALHLHYALRVTDNVVRKRVLQEFPRIWRQVIDAVGEKAGVDVWARARGGTWADKKEVLQADAMECEKSPSRYLAKYVSKNAGAIKGPYGSHGQFLGPVRWWGVSRPLLKALKEMTMEVVSIGIPWRNIAQIKEDLLTVLDGINAKIQRYTDRAKSAEVFLTYDEQNAISVFREIARLVRVAPRYATGDLCDALFDCEPGKDSRTDGNASAKGPDMAVKDETKGSNEEDCARHGRICDGSTGERRVSFGPVGVWGQLRIGYPGMAGAA
jgi:hypothetical protein